MRTDYFKVVAEGTGGFDGKIDWEERHTLDIAHEDDVQHSVAMNAEILAVRYGCSYTRRGKTSWSLTEPGELHLWVRAYPIYE